MLSSSGTSCVTLGAGAPSQTMLPALISARSAAPAGGAEPVKVSVMVPVTRWCLSFFELTFRFPVRGREAAPLLGQIE